MIKFQTLPSCSECRHWMCVNYTHNAGVCTNHPNFPIRTGSDPGCLDYSESRSHERQALLYGEVLNDGS